MDEFYHGIMAALDVIYSFDNDPKAVLPVELIRILDSEELLKAAKKSDYYNLRLLRKTISAGK